MMEHNEVPEDNASHSVDMWSRTIVALMIGILIGAVVSLTGLTTLADYLMPLIIGFVVFVLFMAGLSFILVQNKEKVLHKLFGVKNTDLSDVKDNALHLFINSWKKEFPAAKKNFNALFTKILAWYAWMSFRRWILLVFQMLFIGFGGVLGTMLLYNQNKLLTQQNLLLQSQNYRLDQQTYLQEADRRSSLIFLMGNLLDAMDRELKSDVGQPGVRDLSPQIIGRVVALSKSLRPYRYLESDSLVARELSPERGQLLVSIVNSQIDNSSLRRIFQFSDFSFADLKGVVLSGEFLSGINLRRADLANATLDETDLSRADLSGADLSQAVLARANLREARFRQSIMINAYLESADLTQASFYEAKMRSANLAGAMLRQTHFTKADLSAANLFGTTVLRTGFDEAILDSVQVNSYEWLAKLPTTGQDSIRGMNYLISNYKVDSVRTNLRVQYLLLKKGKE
ncbi:MAG: pentapeptide repeat-containing protein [Phycisphaerae bacterium]|nr:pentapeptide repeat-containing protein [Saprospiraceae bacterium]